MAVPVIKIADYEADDVIGTIAKRAEAEGYYVDVLTSDRDMLQLIDDKTTIRLLKKGLSEIEDVNAEVLMETMEVVPSQIPDMKGLMGDSADNIPGVPGIGPKTATKLLKQFTTLEAMYERIDELKGKQKEKLIDNKEQAFMSKDLATIRCNVEIPDLDMQNFTYSSIDLMASQQFFREIESNTLVKRAQNIYDMQTCTDISGCEESVGGLLDGVLAQAPELTSANEEIEFSEETILYMEHPYENYHVYNKPLFIGIQNDAATYIFTWEDFIANKSVLAWLADASKGKIVFDSKKIYSFFGAHGIPFTGITFDVQLASYVINPIDTNDEIADIANNLEHALYYQEHIYGKGAKFSTEDTEKIIQYVEDATNMMRICATELQEKVTAYGLLDLLVNVEMPLAEVLADMENVGVRVDAQVLEAQGTVIKARIDALEAEIHDLAGEPFNISSPKQLGVILFERLKLPVIKKTKTGYSTAANVLEALQHEHPIIELIGEYRQMSKLNSTYINGLLPMISEDGKIHTIYKQAQTQTGRLSSIEPNLQNIPTKLPEGKLIRKAFTADSLEHKLLAADYSQIELRVLAELAGVDALKDAFIHGRDIHTETARKIFDLENSDEVTALMRSQAKAVNFGIIYGMSDFGLATQLNISRHEAKAFIEKYFELFPGIKDYMEKAIREAEKTGYVETILKRRRYFPTINSKNFNERNFAKRAAMNAPIQGSAADILKLAMNAIYKRLAKEGLQSKMILQVHDELIFDVVAGEVEIMQQLVNEEMTKAYIMSVPLEVEAAIGDNWYEV